MIRFLLLFFWSASAFAGVSLDLQKVSLPDFLRVVYGELLQKSFVLDASVVSDQDNFTIVVRDIELPDLEHEARRVLELRGYRVESAGGVDVIRKGVASADDDEVVVYRPAHRSVSYLVALVESLFKPGAFVSRRGPGSMTLNHLSGSQFGDSSGSMAPGGGVSGGIPPSGSIGMRGSPDAGLNAQLGADQDVIIFRGSGKDVAKFQKLVAEVDTAAAELLVKAVVLEVQTTETEGSAVDLLASVFKGKFGINLTGGASVSSVGNAFIKFSTGGIDLSAIYAALSGDTRFKVLTSPRLRVKSGALARFSVGNETPILGSVSYDANNNPVQNVTYRPSGVIFELRPNIRAESSELSVMQQISQFTATTNGVNDSPTLIKREIRTDVVAGDGDLILLGGLDEEKETGGSTGLSFLPAFFRSKSEEKAKTEIVLMIQAERI